MQGLSAELSTTESEDFHSALPATVFPDSRDIFVDDKNKTGTAQYPTHLSTQPKLTNSASRSLHAPTLPSCLPCFPSHHLLPCLPSHRLLSAVPPTVSVVHGRRAYCTLSAGALGHGGLSFHHHPCSPHACRVVQTLPNSPPVQSMARSWFQVPNSQSMQSLPNSKFTEYAVAYADFRRHAVCQFQILEFQHSFQLASFVDHWFCPTCYPRVVLPVQAAGQAVGHFMQDNVGQNPILHSVATCRFLSGTICRAFIRQVPVEFHSRQLL